MAEVPSLSVNWRSFRRVSILGAFQVASEEHVSRECKPQEGQGAPFGSAFESVDSLLGNLASAPLFSRIKGPYEEGVAMRPIPYEDALDRAIDAEWLGNVNKLDDLLIRAGWAAKGAAKRSSRANRLLWWLALAPAQRRYELCKHKMWRTVNKKAPRGRIDEAFVSLVKHILETCLWLAIADIRESWPQALACGDLVLRGYVPVDLEGDTVLVA